MYIGIEVYRKYLKKPIKSSSFCFFSTIRIAKNNAKRPKLPDRSRAKAFGREAGNASGKYLTNGEANPRPATRHPIQFEQKLLSNDPQTQVANNQVVEWAAQPVMTPSIPMYDAYGTACGCT